MGHRSSENLNAFAPIEYVEHVIPGTSLAGPQDEVIDIEVAADALIAHYEFDDPTDLGKDSKGGTSATVSGVTATDGVSGGGEVVFQIQGGSTEDESKYGHVPVLNDVVLGAGHLDFSTGDTKVTYGVPSDFDLANSGDWSIQFEIEPTGELTSNNIIWMIGSSAFALCEHTTSGVLRLRSGVLVSSNLDGPALQINTRYKIAYAGIGTEVYLFVDGVKYSSTTRSLTSPAGTIGLYLGGNSTAGGFDFIGKMYNFSISKGNSKLSLSSRTALLLNSAGTNGSSVMTGLDVGPFNNTMTSSAVIHSTAKILPGSTSSLLFNGSANMSKTSFLDMGETDYDISLNVYPLSAPGTGNRVLLGIMNSVDQTGIALAQNADGTLHLNLGVSWAVHAGTTGTSLLLNKWTNLRLVRKGADNILFMNGVEIDRVVSSADFGPTNVFYLGNNGGAEQFHGYIQHVHIVNGSAQVDNDFVPTFTLPALVRDFTPPTTFPIPTPGEYGLAGKFNGTSDYLVDPSFTTPSSGQISFSFWLYDTGSDAYRRWITTSDEGISGMCIRQAGANTIHAYYFGGTTSNITIPSSEFKNKWTHWIYQFDGTNVEVYFNSELKFRAASAMPTGVTNGLFMGGYYSISNNEYFKGSMDDIRVYNRALTLEEIQHLYRPGLVVSAQPPVASYDFSAATEDIETLPVVDIDTTIQNDGTDYLGVGPGLGKIHSDKGTVLLIHSNTTNGSTTIVDSGPGNLTLTLNGDVQHDSSQFKVGASSILFDGVSDSISIPNSPRWHFNGTSFTCEAWVRPTYTAGNRTIFACYDTTGNQRSWWLRTDGLVINFVHSNDGTSILQNSLGGGSLVQNTWTHVALVGINGVISLFLDGQKKGSTTVELFNSSAPLTIGTAQPVGTQSFQGNMDEIRITNGNGLYSDDFTPSTLPFEVVALPTQTLGRDGVTNNALAFNGVDQLLNAGVRSTLTSGTVSFWAYHTADETAPILDCTETAGVGTISTTVTTNVISPSAGTVYINGVAGNVLPLNTWTHVVVSGIPLTPSTSMKWATNAAESTFFTGSLQELKVYNVALTAEDVSYLYTEDTAKRVGSFLEDKSGNAHGEINGTIPVLDEGYQYFDKNFYGVADLSQEISIANGFTMAIDYTPLATQNSISGVLNMGSELSLIDHGSVFRVGYQTNTNVNLPETFTFNLGQRYRVVITYSASKDVEFYVDGVLISSGSNAWTPSASLTYGTSWYLPAARQMHGNVFHLQVAAGVVSNPAEWDPANGIEFTGTDEVVKVLNNGVSI